MKNQNQKEVSNPNKISRITYHKAVNLKKLKKKKFKNKKCLMMSKILNQFYKKSHNKTTSIKKILMKMMMNLILMKLKIWI